RGEVGRRGRAGRVDLGGSGASLRTPLYALRMRGAVAAGNRDSAEAGAWALREGGTCVDAALAATFAAFVTEGPLTGPSGRGFSAPHQSGERETRLQWLFSH